MWVRVTVWLIYFLLVLAVVGYVWLPQAVPVWADDPPEWTPTNLQLESARVCRHVIEENDFVVAFHYNIHYDTSRPTIPANKLFSFRLLNTNGTDLIGSVVPFAYWNSGYDQGCSGFYFAAADAPDWGLGHVIRISGNPEYFSTPPLTSRTLVNSDYTQETMGQPENQAVLGNYILDVGRKLELNWGMPLLYAGSLGTVLNSTGEIYFRGAITNLQAMAPQIFPIQTATPQYEETEWTEAKGKEYEKRFEDSWVGKQLVYVGNQFHVKWNVITGILVLGLIVALAILCQFQYGTVKPVLIGGPLLMLGGTVMGWISAAIMAITTVLCALYLGYFLMFRHG